MNAMQNEQMEYSIIGTAIHDPICAANLASLPDDIFTSKACSVMHKAIRRMCEKHQAIDGVTLSAECRRDMADPEEHIMRAIHDGFAPVMYGSYEASLCECRKRRILASAANTILQDVSNPAASVDALAADAVVTLQGADTNANAVDMPGALVSYMDGLGAPRTNTGIADFDRLAKGFRKGHLVYLGARPGVGKSALALQMATHVAVHSGPVLMVSLEMEEDEIVERLVARLSGVTTDKIELGQTTEQEDRRLAAVYSEIQSMPIRITTRAHTPMQVRKEATWMKTHTGLAMVVIDYVQLMRCDSKRGSRYEEVTEISRELKLMAMELKVPFLVLTQFNRQSESGYGGKAEKRQPTMAESKDSGSIEQDANIFLILWEPPKPSDEKTKGWQAHALCEQFGMNWCELIIAKNRRGPTGVIDLGFDKPHLSFRCFARE